MWKNWFSAYRSDEEPSSTREAPDDEIGPEDRSRRKKIIAAILAGVALLLLVLLLCLVLLLTTRETQPPVKGSDDRMLRKRKMGRKFVDNETLINDEDIDAKQAHGAKCAAKPPTRAGMTNNWNGKAHEIGTSITYWCKQDPEREQMMVVVCADARWKILYQKRDQCENVLALRSCTGDPLPATQTNPFDWDYKNRNVGTRINYKCNPNDDSPIMRVLVCGKNYEWHIVSETQSKCFCSTPARYSDPITMTVENWDGEKYSPGTTVKYACSTSMGETHFETITCMSDARWKVTRSGSCFFLVDKPLNYTDSIQYCHQSGGELYAINDEAEQDAVKSLLSEETAFDSTCIHKAFIGIREDVSRQWQTSDGQFVSGMSDIFFMLDDAHDNCAAMKKPGNYKLSNVLCQDTQYCQICQYDANSTKEECAITDKPVCYSIKTTPGDFRFSSLQCQQDGGQLAPITNMNQLDQVRDLLEDEQLSGDCDMGFYVDLQTDKRYYKTYKNIQVNYTHFIDNTRRRLDKHCVVIHELQRYMWTDEHCALPSCFMCRMKGLTVGQYRGNNMKFVPSVALKSRSMPKAPTMPKKPILPDDACDPGWVTDGFHCFLFNDTLVTNAEARAICRNDYGTLASLVNPFERNFIVDYLISRANVTVPNMWHVEATGGLPSSNDDDIGFPMDLRGSDKPCVSVHVKPAIGWTVIDCNEKAGFVCHD